jgi:uncharacterized protein (DUF1800 family)
MKPLWSRHRLTAFATSVGCFAGWLTAFSQTPDAPGIRSITTQNGRPVLELTPAPASVGYQLQQAQTVDGTYAPDLEATQSGLQLTGGLLGDTPRFFRIDSVPLDAETLAATTLLHRIAYGPTPDELERVRTMGTAAYINEQLAPETITETLDVAAGGPQWKQVVVSGTATTSGGQTRLYIFMDGPGDAYVDNIRLVRGSTDNGTQTNLLANGSFEAGLAGTWTVSTNLEASAITADFSQSGNNSLHIIDSTGGQSQSTSIHQLVTPTVAVGTPITLSLWYRTSAENSKLVVRLGGSGVSISTGLSGQDNSPAPIFAKLLAGEGTLTDLRAWHILHAVQAKRQLLEVLRQFLENHFVTQVSKTRDYFDNRGYDDDQSDPLSTRAEVVENLRWQEALLRPNVSFLDLLRISAESPAMIIYLDTVGSRGDGTRVANENYARELCELFCFGVDNGYDQQDIVQISRAWTGWTVELVNTNQEFNPFAARSTNRIDNTLTNTTALNANINLRGLWAFNYKGARHNTSTKHIFYQTKADGSVDTANPKTIPARFGPRWAGAPYGLRLNSGQTGTNGIKEGYDLISHMANQPFTMEFISVKLCRLLVHDGFHLGYDFSDDQHTPEEDLIYQCMLAWDNGSPKGQIRDVLRVILSSELFRSNAGSLQKIKTPLEFAVSTVRALRSQNDDGSFTADSDGYALAGIINRAGRLRLFDRAEPDGYPEDAPAWISAGTLTERIRFVQSALMPVTMTGKSDAGAATRTDPVALLRKKLPAGQLNDANAVAAYFTGLLFPAEGTANLAEFRELAVRFLDTADNGTTASPFNALAVGTTNYDLRVRGMVALLMSTQRFHEQ